MQYQKDKKESKITCHLQLSYMINKYKQVIITHAKKTYNLSKTYIH